MSRRSRALSLAAALALVACSANPGNSPADRVESTTAIQLGATNAGQPPARLSSKEYSSAPASGAASGFAGASPRPAVARSTVALAPADGEVLAGATGVTASSAMIIRTGTASVEVGSIDSAAALVRQLAERVGGYVANTSLQSGRDQLRTATIELKIPAERYPAAVSGLAPLGRVETVSETAEDVGEEFVDVEARVANAHRLEARIVDLLARQTGKLADVLEVEGQLARVREEIERYEGRRRFLRTRAAVSTLTITVHERLQVVARSEGRSPIANAVRTAWRNFVGVVAALIASLGVLVPMGVMVWALWWLATRWLPRRPGGGAVAE